MILAAVFALGVQFLPATGALVPNQNDAQSGGDAPDARPKALAIEPGTHEGTLGGASTTGLAGGDAADWYRFTAGRGDVVSLAFSTQGAHVQPPSLLLVAEDGTIATFLLADVAASDRIVLDTAGSWYIGLSYDGGGLANYLFSFSLDRGAGAWIASRGTGYVLASFSVPEGQVTHVTLRATTNVDDLEPDMVAFGQLQAGQLVRWGSTSLTPMGPRASAASDAASAKLWLTPQGEFGAYRETNTLRLGPGNYTLFQAAKASRAYVTLETDAPQPLLSSAGEEGIVALSPGDFHGTLAASTPSAQVAWNASKSVVPRGVLVALYACGEGSCEVEHDGVETSFQGSATFVGPGEWRFVRSREASIAEDKFVVFGVDIT